MLTLKIDVESRDLDKQRMSEAQLEALIGKRTHVEFLNTRNELYRKRKMKQKPPSRAEAIKLMAKVPNLIRRPIVVKGTQIILGFDEEAYRKL